MSMEQNKKIILQHFENMSKAEYAEALKDFAEDAKWWVAGPPEGNGGWHSKQELLEIYTKHLPVFFPKGIKATVDRIIGDAGDYVAVEGRTYAETTKLGKTYQNNYVWLFEIREGKVRTFKEYFDTWRTRELVFGE